MMHDMVIPISDVQIYLYAVQSRDTSSCCSRAHLIRCFYICYEF
jgi:ribosomal protein L30E